MTRALALLALLAALAGCRNGHIDVPDSGPAGYRTQEAGFSRFCQQSPHHGTCP